MTRWLRIAAIGLVASGLAAGFWLIQHPGLALVAAGLGLLWLFGGLRVGVGRPALDALGLLGFCFLAADGYLYGLPAWLALLAVCLTLAGWDLSRFARRLAEAAPPLAQAPDEPRLAEGGAPTLEGPLPSPAPAVDHPAALTPAARMERTHLARLGIALSAGLLLGGLGLVLRFSLGFFAALVIGLVAVYALSRVARAVNR